MTSSCASPTGLSLPWGLTTLGNRLLVTNQGGGTVGAYGIPDLATLNNVPTSSNPSFLAGLNEPHFVAVVPEPGTWAMLGLGAVGAGVVGRRRRAHPGSRA